MVKDPSQQDGTQANRSLLSRAERSWEQVISRLRPFIKDNPGVFLTIAGLLAYAYLRINYMLFYGPLGVRPEDVGYGYGEVLAQSALIVAGLLTVALVLVFSVPYVSAVKDIIMWRAIRTVPSAHARLILSSLSMLTSLVAMIFLLTRIWNPWTGFALAVVSSVLGSASRFPKSKTTTARQIWGETTKRRYGLRGIGLLVSVFLLLTLPVAQAVRAADIREGEDPSQFRILVVDAHLNLAEWLGRPRMNPFKQRECLFHLGSSDGATILFRPEGDEVLRLPTSQVAIRSVEDCID